MSKKVSINDEMVVIGRSNFNSGIGMHGLSVLELLARYFPVSFYPTNSAPCQGPLITLPTGRVIPICTNLNNAKAIFYTDILWNGATDANFTLLPLSDCNPRGVYRTMIAAFDSDVLPPKWVEIMNQRLDCAFFTAQCLETAAKKSGVVIPVGTLPLAIPYDHFFCRRFKAPQEKIRFIALASYHPRKNHDVLIKAFIEEFRDQSDVELEIHSNINFNNTLQQLQEIVTQSKATNIFLSCWERDEENKLAFIENGDIFVNCSQGEGYSIGPREALALGKALVLSDVGPHKDLLDLPGTFGIPASIPVPGRYPEIDNLIIGNQYRVTVKDTRTMLRAAYKYVRDGLKVSEIRERRNRAAEFSMATLSLDYGCIMDPLIRKFKTTAKTSSFTHTPTECTDAAQKKLGKCASKLSSKPRLVVPINDAGFFSSFNVLISFMTWALHDDECHMVLPDWDVARYMERQGRKKSESFCYGRPEDGNIWVKLFEPLYGLTSDEMNDKDFLYTRSHLPKNQFNEVCEPYLTYKNAFYLYKADWFPRFRKQYNATVREHVRLVPDLQREIDDFVDKNFMGKHMFAAHVKHPSHIIEQPEGKAAADNMYLNVLKERIKAAGFALHDKDWGIFLATDQDRVVDLFEREFGDHVSCYRDVRRTTREEDQAFDTVMAENRLTAQGGYQVQNLVANDSANWNLSMAREVIRDMVAMSRCRELLHIVSNVSTAVSYFGPDVNMIYMNDYINSIPH